MGGGNGLDFINWTVMGAISGALTALALLAIFISLTVIAARREAAPYRGALIVFALFVLFAGVGQVLSFSAGAWLQSWWNLATAALSVIAAAVILARLPQYLRTSKIAGELRGQAGFLEEQQALLQAIQDSVSDGIMLIGEEGQIKAFNAAALRILWGRQEPQSKPLPEMKELAIRALTQGQSDQEIVAWEGRLIERFMTNVPGYGKLYVFRDITRQALKPGARLA